MKNLKFSIAVFLAVTFFQSNVFGQELWTGNTNSIWPVSFNKGVSLGATDAASLSYKLRVFSPDKDGIHASVTGNSTAITGISITGYAGFFSGNSHFSRNVGIGTLQVPDGYNLAVTEGILTERVRVELCSITGWCDYVFEEDYKLNSIEEVANHIKEKKHLPNVPSAKEVEENGIDVAEMDATLLRQIEELWLHMIALKDEIKELKKENETLKTKNK